MKREQFSNYPLQFLSAEPDSDKTRRSAAFKFQLMETVNADPRLTAACKGVMLVYSKFMRSDDYTAYASNPVLMTWANLKSQTTAGQARKRLSDETSEGLGYLQFTGRKTLGGCKIYRLDNPHHQFVQMHVAERLEFYQTSRSDGNQFTFKQRGGVTKIGTPNTLGGTNNWSPKVTIIGTNTLDQHLGRYSSEIEETFFKRASDDTSARETVSQMLNGYSVPASVVEFCVKRLKDGSLHPSNVVKIMRTYALSHDAFSYSEQTTIIPCQPVEELGAAGAPPSLKSRTGKWNHTNSAPALAATEIRHQRTHTNEFDD